MGSMSNFDADVKKRPRVTNVKTAFLFNTTPQTFAPQGVKTLNFGPVNY